MTPSATRDLLARLGTAKRRRAEAEAAGDAVASTTATVEIDDLLAQMQKRADLALVRATARLSGRGRRGTPARGSR